MFDIAAATSVTLSGLTVREGVVADSGGGIRNGGTLRLIASTVRASTATVDGGGIYSNGTLHATDCEILGKLGAVIDGGGVHSNGRKHECGAGALHRPLKPRHPRRLVGWGRGRGFCGSRDDPDCHILTTRPTTEAEDFFSFAPLAVVQNLHPEWK